MNEVEKKIKIITDAIEDKKGFDTEVLNIKAMSSIADYFIITSGNSSTQTTSIADEVEDKMFLAGYEKLENKEGYRSARWVLLDYNDVVVHIFHKDERDFYKLEKLWSRPRKTDNE